MRTLPTARALITSCGKAPLSTSNPCRRTAYLTRPTNHDRSCARRTFFANPFGISEPQTITATRTLPYTNAEIFDVICDVASYKHFYPFCIESTVTRSSEPAASNGKTYPEEAKLVVGFKDVGREEFWSRVYCVPETVVEALSGRSETTLSESEIQHHNPRPEAGTDPTRRDDVLSHLWTRWSLSPRQNGRGTEVNLAIKMQFANPVYAALSQAAVPKAADKMIEAFQKRLESVLGETKSAKR